MQTTEKTKPSAGKRATGAATGGAKSRAKPADANVAARKPNAALMKTLTPSKELAAVIGKEQISRPQMTKKVWDYIKAHNLQNPKNRREIMADDKLRPILGADKISMFDMTRMLAPHLSRPAA